MLTQDHASLSENKDGFWIQKQYGESGKCSYLVYHQGLSEFRDNISEAKQRLCDRYDLIQANRKRMGFTPSRKFVTTHCWSDVNSIGSPRA